MVIGFSGLPKKMWVRIRLERRGLSSPITVKEVMGRSFMSNYPDVQAMCS